MIFRPYAYQRFAIQKILDNEALGLFLDMGLGKTVITLTAIDILMYDRCEINKVLVVAPKKVAEDTWTRESAKWDHLQHLRISRVLGSQRQREAALEQEADVYVINRENVPWLVSEKNWTFDMIVIDELSSFKNSRAKRFKALRSVRPLCDRVVGLTGTPSANGLMDLWAEMYLLDRGERLGRTLTAFRSRWFYPGKQNGHVVYNWVPRKEAMSEITDAISDITVSMSAEDYIELPERIDNVVPVVLGPKARKTYRDMEREQLLAFENGDEALALNAASVMTKLLQLANGCIYAEDENRERTTHRIHTAKLDALEEIQDVTDGPLLVFYSYISDLENLQERFPQARVLKTEQDIADWNAGKIEILLAHPASVGYGLNLQDGGHTVVWYGLTWSLELYQQANARLHRQGQQHTVVVHHLIAEGTVDEKVMTKLQEKDVSQAALLEILKERLEEE